MKKIVAYIGKALFTKSTNSYFDNSLTKVKEADQVTETIHNRLKEIQKRLKLKNS
jgi:hypothetical protein